MSNNVENEKTFEYYSVLPAEVRAMIVKQIEVNDRCRFSRCSKFSSRVVNETKNLIYSLELNCCGDNIRTKLIYRPSQHHSDVPQGCMFEFAKECEQKYIRYTNARMEEHWRDRLDDSANLVKFATECFKNKLSLYQKSIKLLGITRSSNALRFEDYDDLRVVCFKNLEILYLDDSVDIRSIISKTRKPLKKLSIKGSRNSLVVPSIDEVYQVQNILEIPSVSMDDEQFMELSALNIRINMGTLTEKTICNFIRMWQSGKLRKNFDQCVWELYDTRFNVNELVRLLGVEKRSSDFVGFNSGIYYYDIRHNKHSGKIAELKYCRYNPSELTFSTKERNGWRNYN